MGSHREGRVGKAMGMLVVAIFVGWACESQGKLGSGTGEAGGTTPGEGLSAVASQQSLEMVEETFLSPTDTLDNVDSPSGWMSPDGQRWLFATAKDSHVIMHFDGSTGELVGRVGGPGTGAGEFMRPNGILIHDDLMIIVERDNRRVQVLNLPEFRSLGTFGSDVLLKPYGITGVARDGGLDLWITDDFDVTGVEGAVWEARVKQFRMTWDDDEVTGQWVRNIGEGEGPGRLTVVESILADPVHGRLLVADEDEGQRNLKVYDLEGRFTGEVVAGGLFTAEPEGLALYACGSEGYIISADQSPDANRFHVLDRSSLEHVGTFAGPGTRNTDGVAILQPEPGDSGESMFYAVHDDRAVNGFAWPGIAAALGLRAGCTLE